MIMKRLVAYSGGIDAMKTVYLILLLEWRSFGIEEGGLVSRDFCAYETMDIKCDADRVVVMETAVNGRMSDGECVSSIHGYIGCQKNVLDLVDLRCSGRHGCKMELPDKTLDLATPCPKDLVRFLSVSYRCLQVLTPSRGECIGNSFIRVPLPAGSLSSLTTIETNCGSTDVAWLIDAQEGQTVSLTLLDFGPKNGSSHSSSSRGGQEVATGWPQTGDVGPASTGMGRSPHCYVYGLVKQRRTGQTSKICGGLDRVDKSFRFSDTALELRILPGHSERLRYFVIHYEVSGCAAIDWFLAGTSVERTGNITLVRCSTSGSTWRLVCEGMKWRGEKPDCLSIGIESPNEGVDSSGEETGRDHSIIFSRATSLVTMTAIAAFIGILIFLVGLCCFARCRRRNPGHNKAPFSATHCPSPEDTPERLKDVLQYDSPTPVVCPGLVGAMSRGGGGIHGGPVSLFYRMDAENDYESMEDGSGGATTVVRHAETCGHRIAADNGLVQTRLASCPTSMGPDVVVHRVQSQILPKNSYFGNAF